MSRYNTKANPQTLHVDDDAYGSAEGFEVKYLESL